MTITIQLNSPKTIDEYEPLVAIYNQVWSDHPGTVNEWQHNDKQWPDTHLFQRFIVHFDDALVAEGAITESRWAHVPGKYGFGYSLPLAYEAIESDGRTIQDAIYDFVLDYLAEHNPIALQSWTREDKTVYMDWLAANGFQQTMRYAESALDVPSFDSSRFDGVREGVAKSGIEILQLSDLQSRDPDWACKAYDMCTEIEHDIPSPDPATPEPFEQFEKGFSHPNFLADGWFVAVDTTTIEEGDYVGVSMLGISQAEPDKLNTWLTGVRRAYRRRGIALATKLHAIDFARKRGTRTITTDNEENNPMYQINLRLGFERKPTWFDFEKKLVEEDDKS